MCEWYEEVSVCAHNAIKIWDWRTEKLESVVILLLEKDLYTLKYNFAESEKPCANDYYRLFI